MMKGIFKKRKRILCSFDYMAATGYGTVTANVIPYLANYFKDADFEIIAINWFGEEVPEGYEVKPEEATHIQMVKEWHNGEIREIRKRITIKNGNITIHSAVHTDGKNDPHGRNGVLSRLKNFDYDAVFIINDIDVFHPILGIMKDILKEKKMMGRKQFKTVLYFPVDADVNPDYLVHFDIASHVVAYTEYGRDQVLKARPDLKVSIIPHGVNHNHFKPLPDEDVKEFREAFFGENAGKVIISNINRNQPRKDIPTTIRGFETFVRENGGHKKAFLYLHMNPFDEMGWNIPMLMRQTSLVEGVDYMLMPRDMIESPPEPGMLNCIYNASDIILNTTTGEGFGLTVVEAMAVKKPVIAPVHTALKEICDYDNYDNWRFFPLQVFDKTYSSHSDSIFRFRCDSSDVAEVIDSAVYEFDTAVKARVDRAYKYVQNLSWINANKKWAEVFKKVL